MCRAMVEPRSRSVHNLRQSHSRGFLGLVSCFSQEQTMTFPRRCRSLINTKSMARPPCPSDLAVNPM